VKILSRNNLAVLVICGLIFSLQGCGSDRAGITPEKAKELDGLSSRNVTVDDRDGDGISNDDETNGWTNACGESFTTDPDNWDSDGDYLKDGSERDYKSNGKCTNPANPDSDGDGLKDGDELRSEVNRTQVTNPIDSDSDDDGLNDYQEVEVKDTNATNQDSDGDMLSDGVEVNSASTNPKLFDSDSDGVSDGIEVCGTTNGSGYGSGKVITVSNSSVNINITDGSDFYTDKLETLVNHYGGGSDCSTPANSNSSDSPDKIDALDPTNDSDGDGRPNASEKAKSKDPLDYNSTYPWITETADGVKMIAAGFEYIPKGSSDGKGFWMGKYEANERPSDATKVDFNASKDSPASHDILTGSNKTQATTLISNSQVSGLTRGDYNISLPLHSQYEDLFRVDNGFNGSECLKVKNPFNDANVAFTYETEICELKSHDELVKDIVTYHYMDGNNSTFGASNNSPDTSFRATTGYISE
jgi:hypothetical protein